jgi:hypothetical protein
VNGSVRRTDEELGDLESGEGSLDNVRDTVAECGHGVVGVLKLVSHVLRSKSRITYHHSVNTRVDQNEHPDGRGHEAHTSPHGQHSAGMVVLLERGATLAFYEDDNRVEDFVELGEVEPPAPESKTLVPDSANVGLVGEAGCRVHKDVGVLASPGVGSRVVGNCVTKPTGTIDLAERVDSANNRVRVAVVRERVLQRADHGHAGDGRVDSQEDIVEDNKGEERTRLRDPPWLVSMLTVVPVEVCDRDGVDGGNRQRNLVAQRALEDVLGDVEWVREGPDFGVWVRNRRRRRVWWELED